MENNNLHRWRGGGGLRHSLSFHRAGPKNAISKTYLGIVCTGTAQAPAAPFHKFVADRPCIWSRSGDRGWSPARARKPSLAGRGGAAALWLRAQALIRPASPPAASELVRALPCRSSRAPTRRGSPWRAATRARGCRGIWRGCWSSSPRCHPSSSGIRPRSRPLSRW